MEKDVKEMIEEVIKKVKENPGFIDEFKADPMKAIKDIAGGDIPDGVSEALVAGVKAKLEAGELGDMLGKLGELFGK